MLLVAQPKKGFFWLLFLIIVKSPMEIHFSPAYVFIAADTISGSSYYLCFPV